MLSCAFSCDLILNENVTLMTSQLKNVSLVRKDITSG